MFYAVFRLFRTRYVVAGAMIGIIFLAIGIARALEGSQRPELTGPPVSASPAPPFEIDDDGVAAAEPPAVPSTSPGGATPETTAWLFAQAWVGGKTQSTESWREGLKPYCTTRLKELMKDADPMSVPANAARGPVRIQVFTEAAIQASIMVEPGTLRLRLIAEDGRWLVDGVDWERP